MKIEHKEVEDGNLKRIQLDPLDMLMLKLSEAEHDIRKNGTISADELELELTE